MIPHYIGVLFFALLAIGFVILIFNNMNNLEKNDEIMDGNTEGWKEYWSRYNNRGSKEINEANEYYSKLDGIEYPIKNKVVEYQEKEEFCDCGNCSICGYCGD